MNRLSTMVRETREAGDFLRLSLFWAHVLGLTDEQIDAVVVDWEAQNRVPELDHLIVAASHDNERGHA